jgi:PAS domain-containing protein
MDSPGETTLGAADRTSETETELQETQDLYRQLTQLPPDAIAVQCEGVVVMANVAAARLLAAATPEQLVGRKILDFVHHTGRAAGRGRSASCARSTGHLACKAEGMEAGVGGFP